MYNGETRIELSDTMQDAIVKLSEGNPGAINVMMTMLESGGEIDPDSALGGFGNILSLIYGPRIWMLFKDVCRQNINATVGLLRTCQLGLLSEEELNYAIDNYGAGIDLSEKMDELKKELPNFNIGEKYA